MSALKELVGKGIEGARDDESDGPKPRSVTAGYLKRMWKHMESGDFESAAECFDKAISATPSEAEEDSGEEGDGEPSY